MGYPYSAQPVLVSGANIKTIGGESVLGSGDIDAVSSTDLQAALAAYTPTSSLAAIATSGSASDLIIGTLANARLSPQVVRSDFSYPDPSWVTTISASKLTGTIPDARLSSNVPLKDAISNAFTGNLTSPRIYVSGTNPQVSPSTSDGADNRTLILMGGGEYGPTTRGPHITLAGLEAATRPGNIELWAGLNGEIRLGGEQGGGHVVGITVTAGGAVQLREDAWHGGPTNTARVYYTLNGSTIHRGYGSTPIRFWNEAGTEMASFNSAGALTVASVVSSGDLDILGQTEIYGTAAANKLVVYNNATKDYVRFAVNSDTGEARFAGASGDLYIRPYGGATSIIGNYLTIASTYTDMSFITNHGGSSTSPLTLRNSSCLFTTGVWHKDSNEAERFYYASGGASYYKGAGTGIIHEFRNSSNTALARISNEGELRTTSAIAANNGSANVAALGSGIAYYGLGHAALFTASSGVGPQIYLGDSNFGNSAYWNSAPGIGGVQGSAVASELAFYVYTGSVNSRTEAGRFKESLAFQIGGTSGPMIRNNAGALEVRNSTNAAYANINANNGLFDGSIQIGNSGGPQLIRLSNVLTVKNLNNTDYASLAALQLISTVASGGSNASPADSRITLRTFGISYIAADVIGRTYANNAAHGDLILRARPDITVESTSNDFVIRGNTGNVEINRGRLVLADTVNASSWSLKTQYSDTHGQLDLINHSGVVKASLSQAGRLTLNGSAAGATHVGLIVHNLAANATGLKTQILLPVFNGAGGGVIEGVGNSIDGYRMNFYHAQAGGYLTFGTGGDVERMRIDATGNVGIGSTNPAARLEVASVTAGSMTRMGWRIDSIRATADAEPHMKFVRTAVAGWNLAQPYINLTLYLDASSADPEFTFAQGGVFVSSSAVQLGNSGGVRIKNNTGLLEIRNGLDNGNASVSGAGYYARAGGFYLRDGSSGSDHWRLYKDNGDNNAYFRDVVNTRNHVTFYPGVNSSSNGTHFHSRVLVDDAFIVSGGAGIVFSGSTPVVYGASAPWMMYSANSANTLYLRDVTNARMHVTYVQGASSAAATATFHSRLNIEGQVRLGDAVGNYSQMYLGKSGSHSTLLSNGDVDNNFVIQMLSTSTGSLFFDVGTGGIRVRPTGTGDEVFRVSNAGLVYAGAGLSIPGSTLGIAWNGSTTDRLTLNTGPGGRFIIRLGGVDVVDIDRDSQLASSLKISAGNSTFAGHITSAFQTLSADPSTLDISSGMSRLVKNTTSGEVRHWVNDGGTMKKSPAYT